MRQYERSGVHVDQCTECRGIFLDRGELERLIDGETAFHTEPASARPPAPAEHGRGPERHDQRYDRDRGHDTRYDSHGYGQRKKRKSFFEELFD